jgi:hypothetical protein
VVVVAGPALLLAGVGVTHPHGLNGDTAAWWTNLHVLVLPVFPLLGVALWLLLRGVPGPLAWVGRVAAFGYAVFYTALDVLSGIGAGTLMQRAAELGLAGPTPEMGELFAAGGRFATVGTWCFLVACLATSSALVLRAGRGAVPGAVVLSAAAVSFLHSHIYWPVGVLTMLTMAVGLGLLAIAVAADEQAEVALSP